MGRFSLSGRCTKIGVLGIFLIGGLLLGSVQAAGRWYAFWEKKDAISASEKESSSSAETQENAVDSVARGDVGISQRVKSTGDAGRLETKPALEDKHRQARAETGMEMAKPGRFGGLLKKVLRLPNRRHGQIQNSRAHKGVTDPFLEDRLWDPFMSTEETVVAEAGQSSPNASRVVSLKPESTVTIAGRDESKRSVEHVELAEGPVDEQPRIRREWFGGLSDGGSSKERTLAVTPSPSADPGKTLFVSEFDSQLKKLRSELNADRTSSFQPAAAPANGTVASRSETDDPPVAAAGSSRSAMSPPQIEGHEQANLQSKHPLLVSQAEVARPEVESSIEQKGVFERSGRQETQDRAHEMASMSRRRSSLLNCEMIVDSSSLTGPSWVSMSNSDRNRASTQDSVEVAAPAIPETPNPSQTLPSTERKPENATGAAIAGVAEFSSSPKRSEPVAAAVPPIPLPPVVRVNANQGVSLHWADNTLAESPTVVDVFDAPPVEHKQTVVSLAGGMNSDGPHATGPVMTAPETNPPTATELAAESVSPSGAKDTATAAAVQPDSTSEVAETVGTPLSVVNWVTEPEAVSFDRTRWVGFACVIAIAVLGIVFYGTWRVCLIWRIRRRRA